MFWENTEKYKTFFILIEKQIGIVDKVDNWKSYHFCGVIKLSILAEYLRY